MNRHHPHHIALALLAACLLPSMVVPAQSGKAPDLVGRFEGCSGVTMAIGKDARVAWHADLIADGGDVATPLSATGNMHRDQDWIVVTLDPRSFAINGSPGAKRDFPIPASSRFHPMAYDGRTYLLDHASLIDLVNSRNWSYPPAPTNVSCQLRLRVASDGDRSLSAAQIILPAEALLPPAYRKLLLAKPLSGKIVEVGPVSSTEINVGGWMRPAVMKTQHSAKLTIGLGSADGVFAGMHLYGLAPAKPTLFVESVSPNTCVATMHWMENGAPSAGMPVSSAFLQHPGM